MTLSSRHSKNANPSDVLFHFFHSQRKDKGEGSCSHILFARTKTPANATQTKQSNKMKPGQQQQRQRARVAMVIARPR